MSSWQDFAELKCLIDLDITLLNETSLRVGCRETRKTTVIDNPVERKTIIVNGKKKEIPYIPGSTLKGCMRSLAERIAKSWGWWVCNPFSHEDKEREDLEEPCIVCKVFGGGGSRSKRVASHVSFSDAYPERPEEVITTTRTRTAIDRVLGSVRSGALFTVEEIPPGFRWKFSMRITNIDLSDSSDDRAKLLKALLKWLSDPGIHVGSLKSVGYGLVKMIEVKAHRYTIVDGELRKESLTLNI